jgi:hypothetical protein
MNKMTFFRGQTSISFSKFIHLVWTRHDKICVISRLL